MTIALCIGGYAVCSLVASYVEGYIQGCEGTDGEFGPALAMILGPFALVFMAFYLASKAGRKRGAR